MVGTPLLARIHRLTLGTLRKQIEPVTSATFMRWLLRWQHVAPGTQARSEHGTLQVLRQLQGFEVPASSWERHILARRLSNYDPQVLDQLCLTGAVGWGRLYAASGNAGRFFRRRTPSGALRALLPSRSLSAMKRNGWRCPA